MACLVFDFLLLSLPSVFHFFDNASTNSLGYKLVFFAFQNLVHCLAFYFLLKSIDRPKQEKHRRLICALIFVCIALTASARVVEMNPFFSLLLTKLYHKLREPLLFVLAIPFYVSKFASEKN
ncbi:MAG: hypothetical protein ACPGTG_00235 [Flavobacteriales bacterium]